MLAIEPGAGGEAKTWPPSWRKPTMRCCSSAITSRWLPSRRRRLQRLDQVPKYILVASGRGNLFDYPRGSTGLHTSGVHRIHRVVEEISKPNPQQQPRPGLRNLRAMETISVRAEGLASRTVEAASAMLEQLHRDRRYYPFVQSRECLHVFCFHALFLQRALELVNVMRRFDVVVGAILRKIYRRKLSEKCHRSIVVPVAVENLRCLVRRPCSGGTKMH